MEVYIGEICILKYVLEVRNSRENMERKEVLFKIFSLKNGI